jgi:hypothetical protein
MSNKLNNDKEEEYELTSEDNSSSEENYKLKKISKNKENNKKESEPENNKKESEPENNKKESEPVNKPKIRLLNSTYYSCNTKLLLLLKK